MRFLMKQKFWSLGDDFVIQDEQGNDCYLVDGTIFSFGDSLRLRDMAGNEVASINQRLLSWGPSYEIDRPGHRVTVVSKEHFTFFYCKFAVDGPGDEDYEAEGDFMDHEYSILGGDGPTARISKEWFSWSDSYGIEIQDDGDVVLMLATAVVIDLVCHDGKNH